MPSKNTNWKIIWQVRLSLAENPSVRFTPMNLGLNAQNGTPVFDDYTDRRHLLEDKSLEDVVRMVMTKSGTREPVFSGNLFNTFTWRGITLSFNLAYSLGSKVRLFALYEPINFGGQCGK